jgi:hypothetical protein
VAEEGGDKRATARLKSIEQVMTQAQIQKAGAAAEQLSRTLPKNTGISNSVPIQNSFVDLR